MRYCVYSSWAPDIGCEQGRPSMLRYVLALIYGDFIRPV